MVEHSVLELLGVRFELVPQVRLVFHGTGLFAAGVRLHLGLGAGVDVVHEKVDDVLDGKEGVLKRESDKDFVLGGGDDKKSYK